LISENFKEVFTAEIISVTGALVAGSLLVFQVDKLLLLPGLFILIPGFLEMRGSITGSLAARLGEKLHIGLERSERHKLIIENILAAFTLALVVAVVLGIFAYIVSYFLFGVTLLSLIYIPILGSVISNLIAVPLTIFATFWFYKHKIDPDNVMGPFATTTGDIIGVASLLLAIIIVI